MKIERLTPEGRGLARVGGGGKVVFVRYTAPGDEIEAEHLRSMKDYSLARIKRILKEGPGRVPPRCELHWRTGREKPACGGCSWQHLSEHAQRSAKREIVRDCLFRIARMREPRVEETLPSPESWRYRNKVLVPLSRKGEGPIRTGFFEPGSHRVVDYDDCIVQPELSVRISLAVKRLAQKFNWKIYDEDSHTGWLRHLFVRTNGGGKALLALVTRTPAFPREEEFLKEIHQEFPEVVAVHQNIQSLKTSVVLGRSWKKLWGRERLEERVGSVRLLVSPGSFLQINTPACEGLYELIREFLKSGGLRPKLALDLYSGVGSIALFIAADAHRVIGLEENRTAVADAWESARLNGTRNVRFLAGGVESAFAPLRQELGSLEPGSAAAILDPPRAGCERPVIKALRDRALGRLIYVSCNPATFARDADRLSRTGWALKRIKPVDLFPQTPHVELVALFDRK